MVDVVSFLNLAVFSYKHIPFLLPPAELLGDVLPNKLCTSNMTLGADNHLSPMHWCCYHKEIPPNLIITDNKCLCSWPIDATGNVPPMVV